MTDDTIRRLREAAQCARWFDASANAAVTDERERRYAAMVADRNSWRRTAETITAERDAARAELSRLRAELAALKEAR